MQSPPAIDALAALGFTETEALVYCELVTASPATGYRLAQSIGKAPANTYAALSSLVQKGAAMVDGLGGKSFRAVPPAELLAALAGTFEARRAAAEDALKRLGPTPLDDGIYQLKSADQVMQRALAMIERAREILLFDLFPQPYAALRPALDAAFARGVTIAGTTYGAAASGPAPFIVARGADYVARRWPGQQVMVVADAREHLAAMLSRDGREVMHGVWSDSAWLACAQHNGLACEIRLLSMPADADDPLARLSLIRSAPAGFHALLGPDPSEDDVNLEGNDA
jgi:sugar-specific transcriptional regulator TrmB